MKTSNVTVDYVPARRNDRRHACRAGGEVHRRPARLYLQGLGIRISVYRDGSGLTGNFLFSS